MLIRGGSRTKPWVTSYVMLVPSEQLGSGSNKYIELFEFIVLSLLNEVDAVLFHIRLSQVGD